MSGAGGINHPEEEAVWVGEVGSEDGAGGASQTEGILSIVPEIRSGAMLRVQVWPESGDYLGVTAGDRGRWQVVGYEGPPLPLV